MIDQVLDLLDHELQRLLRLVKDPARRQQIRTRLLDIMDRMLRQLDDTTTLSVALPSIEDDPTMYKMIIASKSTGAKNGQ